VQRTTARPVPRKVESVFHLLAGGWIAWLLTDGEWLPAASLAVVVLIVIFNPRRVD
jgi:hypothetical protein